MTDKKLDPIEVWLETLIAGVGFGLIAFLVLAVLGDERGAVFLFAGPMLGIGVGIIRANNRFNELEQSLKEDD